MIIEEGTYDEFKRIVLLALDYNAVMEKAQAIQQKSLEGGYAVHFQGETVGHGLVALWFDYEFRALLPVGTALAVLAGLADATETFLVGMITETATVVSFTGALSQEEMLRLHRTKSGRVAFQTDCAADYHSLFPFKFTSERVDQNRASLVMSLLSAQRTKARTSGGNEWANFALESVTSILKVKEELEKEAETTRDKKPDKETANVDPHAVYRHLLGL